MSRILPSTTTAADLYARVQAQQVARPEAQQAARAEAPRAAAPPPAAGGAAPTDLSAAERETLARYFPEQPQLALRLYGPGRSTQTLHPGAVGSRLDLQA